MAKTALMGENLPLMTPTSEGYHTSGRHYYSDEYTPIDEASKRKDERRKARIRLGKSLAVAAALAIFFFLLFSGTCPGEMTSDPPVAASAEHLFAGLLADDEAFYFPAAKPPLDSGRRSLRGPDTGDDDEVDWSGDWEKDGKDFVAIGEYYISKGTALANSYLSKAFATDAAGAGNVTEDDDSGEFDWPEAAWTADWNADEARGVSLGRNYQSIGTAIDEHYRTCFAADDDNDSTECEWTIDRDLGKSIGECFDAIGRAIHDHYKHDFANPDSDSVSDEKWDEYKKKGLEIADYYKSKAVAIDDFYKRKHSSEGTDYPAGNSPEDPKGTAVVTNDSDQPSIGGGGYAWRIDWSKARDRGIELHENLAKKGASIRDYYRAKYDPTSVSDEGRDAGRSEEEQQPMEEDLRTDYKFDPTFVRDGVRFLGHFY